MSPRYSPRTRLEHVRPLGARVTFIEYEWLPSMFRRIGHAFGTPTQEIANWCGLRGLRRRIGYVLPADVAAVIGVALGFTTEQLETTVMDYLPRELITLTLDGDPVQSKDWTRGRGTRFCVDCLRENPGVFYTYWRLWWSYVCERHRTVLRASCSACGGDVVEAKLTEREVRDPSLCWRTLPNGEPCRRPLTDTWPEAPIDPASPMMRAQLAIARGWSRRPTDVPHVSPRTLRGTGIALLGAGDLPRIAALAGVPADEILGLFDQRERTGGTPPQEPLAMAALLGAAYRLITDPEEKIRATIRATAFNRTVQDADAVEGPGSARYLLSYWPGIDARMRGRVLRALDPDLPPIQRLVQGSAASAEAHDAFLATRDAPTHDGHSTLIAFEARVNSPDGPGSWEWGKRFVPGLMWPSWAAPLGVDEGTDAQALQLALADALRIAGTGARPDAAAIAGIGKRLRPSMLGSTEQTDAILRQLCELALMLRAQPGPIDYERRLRSPTRHLLLEHHWELLAESVEQSPGNRPRYLSARRYAFLRMTAAAPRDMPEQLRFGRGTSDVVDYTRFTLTMSAELKVAFDVYLANWLCWYEPRSQFGAVGHLQPASEDGMPVVAYEPPRFRHAQAALAPELDDIDVPVLHDLMANGVYSLGRLADSVHRTTRHVRWAIAAHPLPSGRLISPVDWAAELARLPQRDAV